MFSFMFSLVFFYVFFMCSLMFSFCVSFSGLFVRGLLLAPGAVLACFGLHFVVLFDRFLMKMLERS